MIDRDEVSHPIMNKLSKQSIVNFIWKSKLMSNEWKNCDHCAFQIPFEAEVCGHCGNNVRYEITRTDKSLSGRLNAGFIYYGGSIGIGGAVVGFFWPGGMDGAISIGMIFYALGFLIGIFSGNPKKFLVRNK